LLAFLIGFFLISFIEVLRSSFFSVGPDVQIATAGTRRETQFTPASFADLADRLKPAVVNISTTKTIETGGLDSFGSPLDRFFGGDDFFDRFFGPTPRRKFKQRSLGSGFIISSDGYIFTNNHVVEQADKIAVKLSNDKEYEAKVIGKDPKTDIALIKIKPEGSLPVVEIGNSDELRVGEWVLAIGNPFGLEQTVTAGIVSAKGRVIGAGPYDNFIQTDASINPGNSGGPLFDMEGKVIGINTAIVAHGQGIGFAIPISMAQSILPDLKFKGKVSRGWLGVSVQDITEDIARSLKKKDASGALITDVFEGDPAHKAGLKIGDIVTEINGKKIKDSHELLMTVAAFHIGNRIEVKALRDGKEMTFRVVVGERKERAELAATKKEMGKYFGIGVRDITPEIAQYLGVSAGSGVVVVSVEEGSAADDVGIQVQDIILRVDKVRIKSTRDYLREISGKKAKSRVLLLIKRDKTTFFVTLRK
jgi:serine protease Do